MGALTSNRKRTDDWFSLYSPCPSFSSSNYFHYSDHIDTRISKKPRVSTVIQTTSEKATSSSSSLGSTVSTRLRRYPEPTRCPREVHAPCRAVQRFAFSSSSSSSRASASPDRMGILLSKYERYRQTKESAFGTFRHVKIDNDKEVIDVEREPEKEDVVLEDYADEVEIIEDGHEVRSVVSDDLRVVEPDGLLAVETQKLDGEVVENGVILASSSAVSDMTKAEITGKMLESLSLDREARVNDSVPVHKRLLGSVERSYSKLSALQFDIDLQQAKWLSIRSSWPLKKPEELKKLEEPKKPEQDLLDEAFAPLTEEEDEEVQRAFSNSNRRKTLVTHENSNIQITGEILQCLRPGAWLNDEVINVYLELLKERERREPKKFLNCHFFNTFFYKKLIGGRIGYDYKSVRRWTTQKKLGYGLIECDKIFVPIHKEVHWCLGVINQKDKKFQYLDSLGGRDSHALDVLEKYFVDEVKDKSGRVTDISSWEREYVDDLPEQHNGYDCGVFMIKYADFYSRGIGLCFSQEHMPYFRRRTAKEILRLRAD